MDVWQIARWFGFFRSQHPNAITLAKIEGWKIGPENVMYEMPVFVHEL
jgi:hypothetical protein